jgi:hypothetical protein
MVLAPIRYYLVVLKQEVSTTPAGSGTSGGIYSMKL